MPVVEFGDETAMSIGIDPLTVAPGEYTAIAAVSRTFPDTARATTLLGGKLLVKIGPGLRPALTLRLVADLNPSPTAIPQAAFTILVWRYSDATDAYSYRIDGAAAGGGTSTASPGSGNHPHKLGNYESLEYWWGEMAEVIEYAAHLTDAECAQVEDYLRTKWGIT
jgi:hypothetical protein